MAFRALALPDTIAGAVWLAAMPGRLEPWETFLAQAREAGLTRIVSLTPLEEIATLSKPYEHALAHNSLPCAWVPLPMRNFALSKDARTFRRGVEDLAQAVQHGEVILLHCAAGIGRTGTAAACLLKQLGLSSEQALQRVRDAGSNPETAVQSGLIELF